MLWEHVFESSELTSARRAQLALAVGGLRSGRVERGEVPGGTDIPAGDVVGGGPVPLLAPLAPLLPQGLRRGDVAVVATREVGPDFLTLALLAGGLTAGLWCAAVGVADLGGIALAELFRCRREVLERLLVVPRPGENWVRAVEVLADGVDVILVRPPAQVPVGLRKRIEARLRQGRAEGTAHRAALLVLGDWPGAVVTLRTVEAVWTGLSGVGPTAGTGQLTGCKATVTALGRATAGRPRVVRLWLPGPDGALAALADGPVRPVRGAPLTAVA